MNNPSDPLLTTSQAARRADLSKSWLVRLIEQGRLPAQSTPYGRLIATSDLERLIAERHAKAAAQ